MVQAVSPAIVAIPRSQSARVDRHRSVAVTEHAGQAVKSPNEGQSATDSGKRGQRTREEIRRDWEALRDPSTSLCFAQGDARVELR